MSGGRRAAVVRSSALLVGLTAVSQVLGFARDAVMAGVYGATAAVDAFLVSQGVMNVVLGLVSGAMARSLVPPVARAVEEKRPKEGQRTVQVALTVTMAVLLVASAVMFVLADAVVDLLAPGFDPHTEHLAVTTTRIVLVATVFVSGTNLLAGAAQAHGRFFWAGVQGVPFNLVMIAGMVAFGARYGAAALAGGFVVGSAARLAAQLPAVRGIGLRLRPSLHVRDPGFREMMRMVPPLLVGSAIVNVNTTVDRAVGSAQGAGTISSLSYGWRVVTLAEVVLVTAFATALFPAFSALGRPERRGELRRATGRVLGVVLVVIAPVVVVLAVAAEPIVVLLFGRGSFDERAVHLTTLAVSTYALALLGLAVREVVARASLAVGDSRAPVLTALGAMGVNVVGDLTLGVRYGVTGLAASTSASVLLAATWLSVLTARRHRALALAPMARTVLAVAVAAAVSAVAGVAVSRRLPVEGGREALVSLAVTGACCLLTYAVVLVPTRVSALADLRAALQDLTSRRR
ncbi:murein biosynthesis integral membrane protein MurJ [Actinopolymorpha singaporensis]|uniref:Lipid II flippase n=1 Tax=Actinopolymorpha singaporensis TaxID=117157 RepID=A0A1H1PRM1_9ACTN|nr:murein biosynthesis integral membrane protein MurJ [Actinopolymorpha singaporensis]SDS13733.1 putative peptidoglycan lipid II flippase [Actinopolymorpha singaporensis]